MSEKCENFFMNVVKFMDLFLSAAKACTPTPNPNPLSRIHHVTNPFEDLNT